MRCFIGFFILRHTVQIAVFVMHDDLLQRAAQVIAESERLIDELWISIRKAKQLDNQFWRRLGETGKPTRAFFKPTTLSS